MDAHHDAAAPIDLVIFDYDGVLVDSERLAVAVEARTLTELGWPITVEEGTNVLAGTDPQVIVAEVRKVLRGEGKAGRRPQLWDGQAATRIVDLLAAYLGQPTAAGKA